MLQKIAPSPYVPFTWLPEPWVCRVTLVELPRFRLALKRCSELTDRASLGFPTRLQSATHALSLVWDPASLSSAMSPSGTVSQSSLAFYECDGFEKSWLVFL